MSKVLVFGGTRFFGKSLVRTLIDNEYDVTIATRGITKDNFEDKVKRITVDRDNKGALEKAFKDKSFNIIYDNICYSPNAALNACSNGTIKIKEIIRMCEEKRNKRWIAEENHEGIIGAFNGFHRYTLSNKKARELGFQFKDIYKEVEAVFKKECKNTVKFITDMLPLR
ncbi:MAG: NAD-dependent epimerase/dehydratase family protein [Clostridiaceae bacterium]